MFIAIIAEGRSDLAVLINLLKGVCNIDRSDIHSILPEYNYDETDLAQMPKSAFSTWTLVQQECQNRNKIDDFFKIEGQRHLIIHLDSDVSKEYGLTYTILPETTKQDFIDLRQNIVQIIDTWLGPSTPDKRFLYAIAINSIESWLLTHYLQKSPRDTALHPNPKNQLHTLLNKCYEGKAKTKFFAQNTYHQYLQTSAFCKKRKTLDPCLSRNQSLQDFVQELEQKIL